MDFQKVYPEWFERSIEEMIESGHLEKVTGSGGAVTYKVSDKGEIDSKIVKEWLYRCK
jgi:hypothetical protein